MSNYSGIAGFAYEAALHCISCTETRFNPESDPNVNVNLSIDNEGNEISPVFRTDEPGDCGDYCDDCHDPLLNMPDDWDNALLGAFIQDNRADMLQDLTHIVSGLKQDIAQNPDWYTERGTDAPSIDVRLCVDINHCRDGGTWIIRTGLVDYDQRHSEYCGASCVGADTDSAELLDDLIGQLGD